MGRTSSTVQHAPKALARAILRAYQVAVSPLTGPSCRFLPTCSDYALECFEQHGFLTAARLTAGRLCRCHPWGGAGFDPVPVNQIKHHS